MKNKTKITYRQVGDYKIPNIILPPEQANITIGKWRLLHKDYMLKHKKATVTIMNFKMSI